MRCPRWPSWSATEGAFMQSQAVRLESMLPTTVQAGLVVSPQIFSINSWPTFCSAWYSKINILLSCECFKIKRLHTKAGFLDSLDKSKCLFSGTASLRMKEGSQAGHWHTTLIGDPCPAPWGLTWRPWPTCLTDEDAESERGWGTWPRPRSSE